MSLKTDIEALRLYGRLPVIEGETHQQRFTRLNNVLAVKYGEPLKGVPFERSLPSEQELLRIQEKFMKHLPPGVTDTDVSDVFRAALKGILK
jgi:hypothetical protein